MNGWEPPAGLIPSALLEPPPGWPAQTEGGGEPTATPTPYRPPVPGGGFVIPPGGPPVPDRRDYPEGSAGTSIFQDDYISWVDIIYAMGGGVPDEPDAASMAGVQSQYLATHAQATIAAIGAEIEAGRLNLDQAEAAFNARMDAFAEAGKQRAEMWQYTVAPGQAGQPLHSDIRGSLDMQPWISQPTEINPFAEAEAIVGSAPIPSDVPSTDPLQDLLDLTKGFLGR